MRLLIKRDQKQETGFFGGNKGVTFKLSCRAELTPAETELISRYKVEGHTLTVRTVGNDQFPGITVGDLV